MTGGSLQPADRIEVKWAWSEALQAVEDRERIHKEEVQQLRQQGEAALVDRALAELTARLTAQLTAQHEKELASRRANVTTALASVREQYEQARAALEQRAHTFAAQAAKLEAELRERVARDAEVSPRVSSRRAWTRPSARSRISRPRSPACAAS